MDTTSSDASAQQQQQMTSQSPQSQQQQQQPEHQSSAQGSVQPTMANATPSTGGGPQLRSRITVVCAECKRLKLKCDRRNPCGSCVKRETVQRCVYSAAATEKVDLHSLNNRLINVESQIALLSSCPPPSSNFASSSSYYSNSNMFGRVVNPHAGSVLSMTSSEHRTLWSGLGLNVPSSSAAGIFELSFDTSKASSKPHTLPVVEAYFPAVPSVLADGPPPARLNSAVLSALPPASIRDKLWRARPGLRHRAEAMCNGAEESIAFFAAAAAALALGALEAVHMRQQEHPPPARSLDNEDCMLLDGGAAPSSTRRKSDGGQLNGGKKAASGTSRRASAGMGAPGNVKKGADRGVAKAKAPPKDKGKEISPGDGADDEEGWRLLALARQALGVAESQGLRDADWVQGALLVVKCTVLYGGEEERGSAFGDVGKLVNAARLLELSQDPEDDTVRTGPHEVDRRRRIWWEVLWWDLFVSDMVGQTPLITDQSFAVRTPADMDDVEDEGDVIRVKCEDESPQMSYFEIRCRLALLVRSIRRRSADREAIQPLTLEQAAMLEAEAMQWLTDIPSHFQLSQDSAITNTDAELLTQRCEVALTVYQLVLKLYLPFICAGGAAHHAIGVAVNAAHNIVNAAKLVHLASHAASPSTTHIRKGAMRLLFDAAAMCAHATVRTPTAVWAAVALEDLDVALDLLREARGSRDKAVDVLQAMKERVEAARRGEGPVTTKRKRDESLQHGEQIEMNLVDDVGLSSEMLQRRDSSARPAKVLAVATDNSSTAQVPSTPVRLQICPPSEPDHVKSGASETSAKDIKGKKSPYPAHGVRLRNKGSGSVSRDGSGKSANPPPIDTQAAPFSAQAIAPAPVVQSQSRSAEYHGAPSMPPTPISSGTYPQPEVVPSMGGNYYRQDSDNVGIYEASLAAPDVHSSNRVSHPPQHHTLTPTTGNSVDYPQPFGHADDTHMNVDMLSRRRFSVHDAEPPHQHAFNPHVFDQPASSPSYPAPPGSSSGHMSNGESPYTGGSGSAGSTHMPSPPYVPSHHSTPHGYGPGPAQMPHPQHPTQGYYMHEYGQDVIPGQLNELHVGPVQPTDSMPPTGHDAVFVMPQDHMFDKQQPAYAASDRRWTPAEPTVQQPVASTEYPNWASSEAYNSKYYR